ncbi:MAG: hypothetical protein HY543_09255 [Deltaproteobacteria bacterium]|nr:hypothetical protein [Deltaproteobacteria bacterium]
MSLIWIVRSIIILIPLMSCRQPESFRLRQQALTLFRSQHWEQRKQGLMILAQLPPSTITQLDRSEKQEFVRTFTQDVKEIAAWKISEEKLGKSPANVWASLNQRYPPETRGEYQRLLVDLLVNQQSTESLPILFDYMVRGNHTLSTGYLTLYGKEGLRFLKEKANSPYALERDLAIAALALWANPPSESEDFDVSRIPSLLDQERTEILQILIQASHDIDYNLRYTVILGLRSFLLFPGVQDVLQNIAASDPEEFIRKEAMRSLGKGR